MANFFKKAFENMKESAKAQHEVDKANLEAVKAESRATFEENKGKNTFKKAKEQAKQSWEDAKMTPTQRQAKMQKERDAQIAAAKQRYAEANARIDALKN